MNELMEIEGYIDNGVYFSEKATRKVKAIEYLKSLPRSFLPKDITNKGNVSNSEMYRWLKDRAIIINGVSPLPNDYITLPITELVFFPKGRRKTTLIK